MKVASIHYLPKSNITRLNHHFSFRPSLLSQVTEDDLKTALTPIHTLVLAKHFGKKWK